ncbi:hypothetical protein DICVIV_02064 [Dictyocaulus viviparus]|uniref:Uncharacterized protein n=1 Tax=Dictyocaulus viviparus TaxID=29172 RepID=A0A0D8Y4H8_DICVI|nr:hypothetical protein DICVIV_02064 [Dictyocaulus viviparus]
MSGLFILLLLLYCNILVHSNVVDTTSPSSKIEEQLDDLPMTINDGSKSNENDNAYTSEVLDDHVFRYPLTNWIHDHQRNSFVLPYYNRIPYGYPMMNNLANVYLNHIPYGRHYNAYQRPYQYPWRSSYPPESDIQFSYLMNNPLAAMTYQGLLFSR